MPITNQTVLTDRATGVPLKFLRRTILRQTATDPGGVMEEVETRTYEPGLKIEPPVPVDLKR